MEKGREDMNYRTKSLKNLICDYAFEVGRTNQQDRDATQKAIVSEVYARIKNTFDMIDSDPESVEQIYKQLIEH